MSENKSKYICWFDEISIDDVPQVRKECLNWRNVQGVYSEGCKNPKLFRS